MPEQYIPHRWLSILDVGLDTLRQLDGFVFYYYSFLKQSDKELHKDVLDNILERRNVKDTARTAIKHLQGELKKSFSSLTKEGKDRKARISDKVFLHQEKTELILNFYCSVLPVINKYVLFFQRKEPLMHELHDKIILKLFHQAREPRMWTEQAERT